MTRVYIYCRNNLHAYQDDVVVLAEGLQAIGVEVFGNCNYWQRSTTPGDWLLRHDPRVTHADCDIVIISYGWSRWIDMDFRVHETPLPADLFAPGRRYRTAFLDLGDGYYSCGFLPEYRAFDAVFRAKYNERCFHPANHIPWALGLSQRMIDCTAGAPPWAGRNHDLLVNFNASHPYIHPARANMEDYFTPVAAAHFNINRERDDLKIVPMDATERLMWEQTQHRHSHSYYERLRRSQAVAAFCGEMIPPAPLQPPYLVGGRRAKILRAGYDFLSKFDARPPRLIQWDSWRFWESLAAGCLVFNFDLPHYGVKLPVMPENWKHYIGIDLERVDESIARLEAELNSLATIAQAGRVWALEHYSPHKMARRFLDHIGFPFAESGPT